MKIRKYQQEDESSWLRCRVLSFLDTAYYDIVIKKRMFINIPVSS